jgi:hypothetical protein
MNHEWAALGAIGSLTIVLGLVLLIPGLWWARRSARAEGNPLHVTKIGVVVMAGPILALLVVASSPFWGSYSAFGQWLAANRLLFIVAIFVGGVLVEWFLRRAGIKITFRKDAK